jgi:hypothetical protein
MRETIQKLRDYGGHIKAMFALAGFVLAGALLGGTLASAYYRETLQQERDVTRVMFTDLAKKIDDITERLDGAANAQAVTADKLQDAASTVSDVVEKVDQAAAKADKAAKAAVVQAARVGKSLPAQPTAVQPEVVNREIRKANEKLKERAGK